MSPAPNVVQGHKTNMHYVYVLISLKDYKFYIGYTENLENRLEDHPAGRNTSTKSRRPFQLFYYEAHCSKEDAERRERYFKTAKGKPTLRQMLRTSLADREELKDQNLLEKVNQGRKEYKQGDWVPVNRLKEKMSGWSKQSAP